MFTTQIILCGVAFDVEIEYDLIAGDPDTGLPDSIEIRSAYLLGAYPDGIEHSGKSDNSIYLNFKCNLDYLTIEEHDTLDNACWEHHRANVAEAWDRNLIEESEA